MEELKKDMAKLDLLVETDVQVEKLALHSNELGSQKSLITG